MTDERLLIEKLLRIEALFARAGTDGEKAAAGAAERIRRRLEEVAKLDPPIEYRFTVADGWSRKLLLALLRRYGVEPYRYRNQRRTTVMARVRGDAVARVRGVRPSTASTPRRGYGSDHRASGVTGEPG